MTKTIFKNTFLVGVIVLAVCALLSFGLQYRQTIDETYSALEQETFYAASGFETGGSKYLKRLDDTNRITRIEADGDVIYDSEYKLPLPNQKKCIEVREAISKGKGQGIRKSASSGKRTMYFAQKLSDGTVLRLSRPVSAVWYAFSAVSPVFWVLIIVLIISGVLSFRAARKIVGPINSIDLDHPKNNPYPELSPLIGKIEEQKMAIQEESQKRGEMRREFTANVSHELKTPITSIAGFAELLATGDVSEDKVVEFSKDIHKESQRLITLIDDIIDLSKLDEEADFLEKETVDLYEMISDVADSLKSIAEKNAISIEVKGKHAQIEGVYQILYEMIFNLCDNAIKYNHPGGKVVMETFENDSSVTVTVADTGIGIPKEHQSRVFERFYRVDKSHFKEIGGTGLGLSIVKHGAIFHDASISMESTEGKGTEVSVSFPK